MNFKKFINYIIISCIVLFTFFNIIIIINSILEKFDNIIIQNIHRLSGDITIFLSNFEPFIWILFLISSIIYILSSKLSFKSIYTLLNVIFLFCSTMKIVFHIFENDPITIQFILYVIVMVIVQIINIILLISNKYNYSLFDLFRKNKI